MGMFTTVIDTDGCQWQFKCGFDNCETYKVGDTVQWKIHPDEPGCGKLLDGVYEALCGIHDSYVIIKNHKIDVKSVSLTVAELEERLDIKIDRSWWSESAWAIKDIKDAELRIEIEQRNIEFLQSLIGKKDEEIIALKKDRLGVLAAEYIWERLASASILSRVIKLKP